MFEMLDQFFSPLPGEYCEIYYWFTVIEFFILIISIAYIFYNMFFSSKKDKLSLGFIVLLISQPFVGYVVSRLEYSICIKALNYKR
jgi:hypothetical protein